MDQTKGIPGGPGGEVRKQLDDGRVLLSAVRSSLADLLADVRGGNAGALKELATKQSELERALARVFDAEQKYNEWLARETGELVCGDIDFDAARREIGRRLSRLRECGPAS